MKGATDETRHEATEARHGDLSIMFSRKLERSQACM
jgi:hypothetical protein